MKINLKVRAKNPCFWVNITLSIVMPVLGYFGLTAAELTSWGVLLDTFVSAIMNPYVLILVATSVWNELHNPTTRGYSDSTKVLEYTEPEQS